MRLDRLYLDGFGQFHQRIFGPISTPVTVFYGPNEAGKSTLLAFIRTVLFGFPGRGRDKYYPALSGGQHGGRIWLSNVTGDVYIVERFAGVHGGTLSVRTESGEELEAAATLSKLTGNATPDLFKNVFAFSLDELQTADLMNDSEVAGRVYGVGYGVSKLSGFTKSLDSKKRKLYLPTGQQQAIANCLKELLEVETPLRDIENNAEKYSERASAKSAVEQDLDGSGAKLVDLNARSRQVGLLMKGRNDWQALSDCEVRLDQMPQFEQFPENSIPRLEALQSRVEEAEEDYNQAVQHLQQWEATASSAFPGEELLAYAGQIEVIRRARSSFDNSVKDLPERQGELSELESELSRHLGALGKGWDEARIGSQARANPGGSSMFLPALFAIGGMVLIAAGFVAGGAALPTGLAVGFGVIAGGALFFFRGVSRRAKTGLAGATLAQVRNMRHRVAAIEKDIGEFRQLLAPIALARDLRLEPEDPSQWAEVADALIDALNSAHEASVQQEQTQQQAQANQQALTQKKERLQSAQEALVALLVEGGTDNPQAFRERAEQHGARIVLEQRKKAYLNSLTTLSGSEEGFAAFRALLDAADFDQLNQESESLVQQIRELGETRAELQNQRGSIDNQLAQLAREEESSALRLRRNILLEQLGEYASEWSRLSIAEVLVEKTRRKFEKEHQPKVIQHAQEFFSKVTGHRYPGLYVPVGQQTVTVTDETGSAKQPSELSRGTREQLYLALRFGLIREFGEHAEPLPVVVDEALVNFDPERANRAAESFAELAQTNQVLVFTCHPNIAELFATVAGAVVIDITGDDAES